MTLSSLSGRVAVVAVALSAVFFAAPAFGQGAPVAGAITLSLAPSSITPLVGTNFTVDLSIDMTAATGTCTTPAGVVPMTLGAYNLGIQYDSTKLGFVSTAACPTIPSQINTPACVNNTAVPATSFVNCNAVNNSSTSAPIGNVCVARVTFTNLSATTGGPTSLVTLHTGGARSVATELYGTCGGPVTFPAGSITDGTVAAITPVALTGFSAE